MILHAVALADLQFAEVDDDYHRSVIESFFASLKKDRVRRKT